jgi:UDP-2,3-diacylglucosamine hydrolase
MINDIHHQPSTINYQLLTINEGAIFIADSHYNKERNELVTILEKIKSGDIQTTQLFLMGDIFDFLCGESEYFIKINQKPIQLINDLSNKIEIFYFEGNHDFNLSSIFPTIKIFPRENQPVVFDICGKRAFLSHGDIFTDFKYDIFCKIIRNNLLLKMINFFDFGNFITKRVEKRLNDKKICRKIDNFDTIINKRIDSYPKCEYIIEGHFHQNMNIKYKNIEYFNLPSAFCSKKYARMSQNCNLLEVINI